MTDIHSTELAAMNGEFEAGDDFAILPTTRAVQRLEMHERAMAHAHTIAKVYSWSDAVPEQYSRFTIGKDGEPLGDRATYNATIAILHGSSLGLPPDAALENIFMIKGKPATFARMMVSLVYRWIDDRVAAGRTSADPDTGDRIWEVEASATKCVWAGRRDGITKYSEWDIGRAQQANYTTNKLYQSIPQEMLTAKAQAEVCRIVFPDVILGLSHSIEELRLEEGVTVQRVQQAGGPKRGVRGAAALREIAAQSQAPGPITAQQAPPAAPEPQDTAEPAPEAPAAVTQIDKLKKLYKDRGLSGRPMLDDIVQFLQLPAPISGVHKLSAQDVDAVIEYLEKPAEGTGTP